MEALQIFVLFVLALSFLLLELLHFYKHRFVLSLQGLLVQRTFCQQGEFLFQPLILLLQRLDPQLEPLLRLAHLKLAVLLELAHLPSMFLPLPLKLCLHFLLQTLLNSSDFLVHEGLRLLDLLLNLGVELCLHLLFLGLQLLLVLCEQLGLGFLKDLLVLFVREACLELGVFRFESLDQLLLLGFCGLQGLGEFLLALLLHFLFVLLELSCEVGLHLCELLVF